MQRLAFHGHAEHRQGGHRCDHARKMGSAAGTGDDDLKAILARRCGEIDHAQRRAVRRNDTRLIVEP